MARGSEQATQAATTGQQFADQYGGNAGGLFSTLAPMLMTEAANPPGMTPTEMAQADTAGQQSAGGATAGATGLGALKASRTGNLGGADAATAAATRMGGEQASTAALGTRLKNAALKQQQRQAGMSGLEGLFGQNVTGGNQALGVVPQAVNANTQAASQSWDWARYILDPWMQGAQKSMG